MYKKITDPETGKKINIKSCNYELYKNKKGVSVVDDQLESVGVYLNGVCFVPPWFKKD